MYVVFGVYKYPNTTDSRRSLLSILICGECGRAVKYRRWHKVKCLLTWHKVVRRCRCRWCNREMQHG